MAKKYTNDYEDLLRDIQSSGQNWSQYDLDLARENPDAGRSIYTYKQQYYDAATDEERMAANQGAEAIRSRYGNYNGGSDGSGYILSDKYAPQYTQYASQYKGQIDSLMNQLLSREAFSYNPAADPSYQAYSEKYRNLGSKAMQNALGSAAAMTGGQLSSYAMTAAQQAQNDYNAQMSNVIPELQQLAYSMYVGEGDAMRANLNSLNNLDQMAYSQHVDEQNAAMDRWQANYGVDADQYERDQYEREQQYAQDLYLAELMAGTGDYGRYTGLGLTDDERAKLENAYQQSVRESVVGDDDKTMSLTTARQAAENGVFREAVLNVLRGNGYDDEMIQKIYGYAPNEVEPESDALTYDGLGAEAKQAAAILSDPMFSDPSVAAAYIEQMWKNEGAISEAEADYLLRMIGY